MLINFLERLEHQGKYLPIHFYIKNAVNLFIIVDYWPVCTSSKVSVRYELELCMDDMLCC